MKEDDMRVVGDLIHEAIQNREEADKLESIRLRVAEMNARFPLP